MTRDKQIEKLTKELTDDIELSGRDKVNLLKTLLIDKRAEEKLQLEMMKFKFVEEHRNLLTRQEEPGPYWVDGPQGLNRRLLDCDKSKASIADGTTG